METDQDIVVTDDHVTVALDIDKAADDMDNIHLRDKEKGDEVGVPVATDKDTSKINWAADVSAEYRLNKTTASEKDLETRSAGGADKAELDLLAIIAIGRAHEFCLGRDQSITPIRAFFVKAGFHFDHFELFCN